MEMSGYGYRASAGENVYAIARDIYGDEKYAAELLCANPEYCLKIRMTGGEIWRLPTIDVPQDDMQEVPDKAPWKE
jgi:hypothetical protein